MTMKSYAVSAGAVVLIGAGATVALGSGGLLAVGTAAACTAAKCGLVSKLALVAMTGISLKYGTQGALKASEALSEFLIDCAIDVASSAKTALGKFFGPKIHVYSLSASRISGESFRRQVDEAAIVASAAA